MKAALSAAILAITLAWVLPAVAREGPSEEALWVRFEKMTYGHVERYLNGEFGEVVLVVEAGNRFILSLSIHGDVLTTYGTQTMEVYSQRDIYIFVNGRTPPCSALYSFDGAQWFPAEELFRGCFHAEFDGQGASVSMCLIGANPASSVNLAPCLFRSPPETILPCPDADVHLD